MGTTHTRRITAFQHFACHIDRRQAAGAGRIDVNTRPAKVKIPADAVRYNAGDDVASGRRALYVLGVYGRHAGEVLDHGGGEHRGARAPETRGRNSSYSGLMVSQRVRSIRKDSWLTGWLADLTFLESAVRCFKTPSLQWVHRRRLLSRDGEERGVEGGDIVRDEVTSRTIYLRNKRLCELSMTGFCEG